MITSIVDKYRDQVYLFRENQIQPVVAEKQHLLSSPSIDCGALIPSDAYCLMLYHRIFEQDVKGATLKNLSVQNLYNGDYLISKVIRKAYPVDLFGPVFGVL